MLTAIYLQRRRILFGMLFYFLAGQLSFGRSETELFVPAVVLSGLFAIICGALAALLIPFFLNYRTVFEISAVMFFAIVVFEATGWTGHDGGILNSGSGWGFVILALGFTVLNWLVYGDWWLKTPFRLSWTGRSRFRTSVPPATAWKRLVPAEDRPEDYFSGTLHEFRPVENADWTHLLRFRMGGPGFAELRARLTQDEAPRSFAYDFSADVSEKNRKMFLGDWRIALAPEGDGTAVEVVDTVSATLPSHALFYWFDDLGGQVAASMKRVLEDRRDPTILGQERKRIRAIA